MLARITGPPALIRGIVTFSNLHLTLGLRLIDHLALGTVSMVLNLLPSCFLSSLLSINGRRYVKRTSVLLNILSFFTGD